MAISENPKNLDDQNLYLESLPSLALNTSWFDIYKLLKLVESKNPHATICDLGAGNCRMAIIAKLFFPTIRVISVEPIKQRMLRAQEICQDSHNLFYSCYFEDLSEEISFDFIFLYFPNGDVFEKILRIIKKLKFDFTILAIESHGEMIHRLSFEKSWLERNEEFKLIAPRHRDHLFSFKKTHRAISDLEIKLEQIKDHCGEFLIKDNIGQWLASSKDLNIYFDSEDELTLSFSYPPRTIKLNQENFTLVSPLVEIPKDLTDVLHMRDQLKEVRKVYLDGNVELSSGKICSFLDIKD